MVAPTRSYLTVEVKPEHKSSKSNSSTPPSSPGKAVRFVHCVKSEPRDLTYEEQWSLYHFEKHARLCATCYNPSEVFAQGRHLCSYGHSLALDVATHLHMVDGVACSKNKENHKHVPVKLPQDYSQVPQILAIRRKRRSSTTPSDEHKPVIAPRRSPERFVVDGPVTTEPQFIPTSQRTSHKSRTRTPTPELDDDSSTASQRRVQSDRRGSIYDSDSASPRRGYRVEIRMPESRNARKTVTRDDRA